MKRYAEYRDSEIPWLGEIPSEWDINRGKEILTLLERPVLDDDEVITCFRDGEVTLRKNRREDGFTVSLKEVGYQGIEPGDLVVHGMDGFAGSIGVSDSRGKATPVLNVMDSKQNKRFLMYYLRMAAYRDVFMSLSTGIRVRSCDLRWNKLSIFPFLIPPIKEQNAIAEFIDINLSKVDALISEAKASIDEYRTWKASIIYEAVTKGVDKNVEMKESGLHWIGKIPSHWYLIKLKYLLDKSDAGIKVGPFGSSFTNKTVGDGDYLIYGQANVISRDFSKTKNSISASDYKSLSRYDVVPGDICLSVIGNGTIGWCCTVPEGIRPGIMDSHLMKIRLSNVMINEFFELYYSKHYAGVCHTQMQYEKTGIAMEGLNTRIVKGLWMVVPPIEEQYKIVKKIMPVVDSIDMLISEKESLITDLEAYKKSLIFEVVTGKRKVV